MHLRKGEIIGTLVIDNEAEIPTNSKFRIISTDFFGAKGIEVMIDTTGITYLAEGDTVLLESEAEATQANTIKASLDSILQKSLDLLILTDSLKQDSVRSKR